MNEELIMSIILYSGNARSRYMQALKISRAGEKKECQLLIDEARVEIEKAHVFQTKLINENITQQSEINLLTIHAQDHLMTTMILRDIAIEMIARDWKVESDENRI